MPLVAIVVIVVVGVLLIASSGLVAVRRRAPRGPAEAAARLPTAEAQRLSVPLPKGGGSFPDGGAPVAEQDGETESVAGVALPVAERPLLRQGLGRARALLGGHLAGIRGRVVDDATFEELEEALILADVGLATTTRVLDDLRSKVKSSEIEPEPEALLAALRTEIEAIFEGDSSELAIARPANLADGAEVLEKSTGGPTVWLFVGVNGAGKTTTIGKIAARETARGRKVVLAAGDTFRAAAGEQLETWAERSGARLVRGADGADPSSVIFDAVQHAAARGADLVIADTAGRLHTKVNLMEELRKVRRIAERPPGNLTEVLLVLDATVGQNGLVQARQFTDAVDVTGVVLTKLDGTAKGGVVVAVRSELGVPIKLVGLGEGVGDLVEFDPKEFVAALFE
ncbi:MAG: signal recognition particle-docking protein FtsY [Acidimicrobiales bacterium]